MENLLESNERTLVLFDSVCSGLTECLTLVHSDIKQMTEHRNKLAQLEHDQIQAKLMPVQDLDVPTNNRGVEDETKCKRKKQQAGISDRSIVNEDDPHHLAGLKLLDKRLADSFSHAFSLNDLQKSSIAAKQQAYQNRPSIFQVLLGKTNKTSNQALKKKSEKNGLAVENDKVDNKVLIDDINRQTRLAMQYSKQLEANLFKVEDLRSKYEMHLKMGLVVKSVALAYLGNGSSNMSGSLARRHHCSSLMINDSSSIGTRSSLSSLNLSTWSSSRSRAHKRRDSKPNNSNQMFVSTISLNNKHQKRINLAKLISSSTNKPTETQYTSHNQTLESPYLDDYAYTDWNSPELPYGTNDTLSKSSVNLNVNQGSKVNKAQQAASSKTTIKEFIDNIDRIESEFESFMGSFLLAIEDIQGFARVCQGDVFEITIKYGASQKFKTKISVLKDSRQKCENRQTVFKARIADILAIKAYECKGLGKRVLLGHKLCETRDLFTARSQLMTISLNQTGSIKLNLIVTWNPLHLAPNSSSALPGMDISHISLPPTPISSSTLSSLSSIPSLNGTTTTINIQSQTRNKLNNSPNDQDSMYQNVDPTYGYYIPPPDYNTNDQKY